MMNAGESPQNPVYTKILSTDMSPGKIAIMIGVAIAPVAIAILMQNPALRQSLTMKFWKRAELTYVTLGGFFDKSAQQCRMKYDLARM